MTWFLSVCESNTVERLTDVVIILSVFVIADVGKNTGMCRSLLRFDYILAGTEGLQVAAGLGGEGSLDVIFYLRLIDCCTLLHTSMKPYIHEFAKATHTFQSAL